MNALSPMDRKSRALWQAQAAKVRTRRAGFGIFRPGWATRTDLRFSFDSHLSRARNGATWDPFWWA